MKLIKYFSLILAVTLMVSCEKHEIEYDATPIGDMAEIQLHYIVPVTAVAANNIIRVDLNNQMVTNRVAPLATYNAVPSGAVGKFFAVAPGSLNIKLYKAGKVTADSLVYDQNVTVTKGKQNLFVHDMTKPPVVIDNGFPYIRRETVETDSTTWVKFYNFLYESAGVTSDLKLQYQYISHRTGNLVNVGKPVAFGEATGWEQVLVLKLPNELVTAGQRQVDYRIKVVDNNGAIVGDLQIAGTGGAMINYSDWWTGTIGRRVHHIFCGVRTAAPVCAVRQFFAL